MPQRRISDDSVRHGCSVNDLTVPFPCAGQMVDLRLPFVLVPGNIGLAIVNETRPAAFELLAPLWWLDAIKDRTEPWSAIVHDRGTVQHLQGARVLPKDFGSTRSICSVIVVYETAAGDMVSKVHGESPVEPSKPFVDGARIEVVAEPFAIHRIFNAAFHLGTHCVVHDDSGRSRVAEICIDARDTETLQLVLPLVGRIESKWVELRGQSSVFRFPLAVCSRVSKTGFKLPHYVVRIRRRRQMRARAPQGLTLTLEFAGQTLRTNLLDVSAMGVRMSHDCGIVTPFPGLTFPTAAIHHSGRKVWNGVLQVTSTS